MSTAMERNNNEMRFEAPSSRSYGDTTPPWYRANRTPTSAERAECTCPDLCDRDHEND